MRKKKAVIFDDEPAIMIDILKMFFEERDYEVLALHEQTVCPVYNGHHACKQPYPCADIVLIDYNLLKMTGPALLEEQARLGCKLTPQNKALMSGFVDEDRLREVKKLGVSFFQKPIDFEELATWVRECEKRIDLSMPLGVKRIEPRSDCREEVTYQAPIYNAPAYALAVNMSSSGMCLQLGAPLAREQKVRLHSNLLNVSQTALVRWIREIDKGQYLAGLQYVT